MTATSKRIVWAGTSLAALATLFLALRPQPIAVEITPVTRGPLTASVVDEGRTRVKDLYVVASPIDGELERIVGQPGDPVRAGAAIARIWPIAPRPLDSRDRAEGEAGVIAARAAVARAAAAQQEADTALVHAQRVLETTNVLATAGAAASNDAEHARHDVEMRRQAVGAARAAVEAAEASLARAEALLATNARPDAKPAAVLSSPVAGQVLRVLRESAGPVSAGTALLEVADTSKTEVVADLLTADAMTIKPGASATITDWGGSLSIAARVRRIDPSAFTKVSALGLEEQRVRVVLDLVNAPPQGLGHNFRVTVSIEVWTSASVLSVPSTALFRSGDRWAVFAVKGGRAQLRLVTPGRADASRTAIDDGLAESETVIAQPSDLVQDGARVQSVAATNLRKTS